MFIDISWPLQPGMVSYKNRHPLEMAALRTVAEHGVADSACLRMHMHTGTHIDAPSHFVEGGITVEQLSLEQMNGPCRVLDLTHVTADRIEASDLFPYTIQPGERILLKTRNSSHPAFGEYNPHEVYLAASAAQYVASVSIALLGIDALGLERNQAGHESHSALLENGIIVLEGLRLAETHSNVAYTLHLLPLAFVGVEAAPARAVLSI